MSDPTIQTFCCHHDNGTDIALTIKEEFSTDTYNILCIISSLSSILGAIYQIWPRREFTSNHRWFSFSAARSRRIITWLAFADLLAAAGVFIRSMLWVNYKNIMPADDDGTGVLFCSISSAFIQYFYISTCIWTLLYALDMKYALAEKECNIIFYHCIAWILPAVLTFSGLTLLYYPDANCHTQRSFGTILFRMLPNYIATYLPIIVVMIANPILYNQSIADLQVIITSISGQYTTKERTIIKTVKMKFALINIVFYICWLPNLIDAIAIWILWFDLPANFIVGLWYIMAFTNPLQAFFNSLVYRRWNSGSEQMICPWRRSRRTEYDPIPNTKKYFADDSFYDGTYPLLQDVPSSSINVYQSLP